MSHIGVCLPSQVQSLFNDPVTSRVQKQVLMVTSLFLSFAVVFAPPLVERIARVIDVEPVVVFGVGVLGQDRIVLAAELEGVGHPPVPLQIVVVVFFGVVFLGVTFLSNVIS